MRYWDASAIVPLFISETNSSVVRALYRADAVVYTWWGTRVECVSALARRKRNHELPEAEIHRAQIRLDRLKVSWRELAPTKELRALAEQLLVEHQLRAADALQLAAAVLMKRLSDVPIPFVCLDDRLTDAARAEGFGIAIDNRG